MSLPTIDFNAFPDYTLSPVSSRHFADDRCGRFVGAYAAARLSAQPGKTVRFTFQRHKGPGLWEQDDRVLVIGLVPDRTEEDALNLHANYNAPLNAAGVFEVAGCATLGPRSLQTRFLNPMLLACAIQTLVDEVEAKLKLTAFLEP